MKSVFFVIAITIAGFSLAAPSLSAQTPAEVTNGFYEKLSHLKVRGLPTADQLNELSPFLATEIVMRIKRNRKTQADFIKKNPGEKPPWIEGDLFSSLFEGPTTFSMGRSRVVGGATHVDVNFAFTGDGAKTEWTDTAVLKRVGGKWRIANIIYKGKWQFKTGSSLVNALK